MKTPIDFDDDTKFLDLERGDNIKVIDAEGNEYRDIVQTVNGGIVWTVGGGLYWQNYGESISHTKGACELCLKGKPQYAWPRMERATIDELDPLIDVSFLK